MLNVGKKMLCVYGYKPNNSTNTGSATGDFSRNNSESIVALSDTLLRDVDNKKKVTVIVRLFPRESQPSSSTRWWTVVLKAKSFFRRSKHSVKITENVGTRAFCTNEARFCFDEDNVILRGQLEDDSVAGSLFVLRLRQPVRDACSCSSEQPLYEGTLARSGDACSEDTWEITHDAVVFRDQAIEY